MTQEEKELLLKDLSARLPYKPICFKKITNCIPSDSVLLEEDIYSFRTGKPTIADYGQHDYYKTVVLELKPYLRPMSSMTEEEREELEHLSEEYFGKALGKQIQESLSSSNRNESRILEYIASSVIVDWLNAHHFDYRGLIEKDLAIEAPKGMYN